MTQKYEVYKCEVCGNIVEVTHEGTGTLVCCGQPMTLMAAKSTEAGTEKHLPVVEKAEHGATIKIGCCSASDGRETLHRVDRSIHEERQGHEDPSASRRPARSTYRPQY